MLIVNSKPVSDILFYMITLPITALLVMGVLYLLSRPFFKDRESKMTEVIYLPSIRRVVEDEQLFLTPKLSIERVAREVGTNETYVSRAINQGLGISFRDYIIRLRIAYAQAYMEARPKATVSEVAMASGYEDPAVFARHYRQLTGHNPSENMK